MLAPALAYSTEVLENKIMNLRLATEKDLDEICLLSQQINTQHYHGAPQVFAAPKSVHRDRSYWRDNFNAEGAVFIVAEIDNKVVGFILALITENTTVSFIQKKKVCRVKTVVVSEGFQGQGIGKKLMEAVELWSISEGVDEVRLEVMEFNDQAQEFYGSIGFQTQSRILSKSI